MRIKVYVDYVYGFLIFFFLTSLFNFCFVFLFAHLSTFIIVLWLAILARFVLRYVNDKSYGVIHLIFVTTFCNDKELTFSVSETRLNAKKILLFLLVWYFVGFFFWICLCIYDIFVFSFFHFRRMTCEMHEWNDNL